MRLLIKLGYFSVVVGICFMFYMEYKSYLHLHEEINVNDYKEQLYRIKINRDIIGEYYDSGEFVELKEEIEYCYRGLKSMTLLELDFNQTLYFNDIFDIDRESNSSGCFLDEYLNVNEINVIYSQIKHEDVYPYEFSNLGYKKNIKELFMAILQREEQTTSAFIQAIEILTGVKENENI